MTDLDLKIKALEIAKSERGVHAHLPNETLTEAKEIYTWLKESTTNND